MNIYYQISIMKLCQSLVVLESFAKALLIMSNSEQKDTKRWIW